MIRHKALETCSKKLKLVKAWHVATSQFSKSVSTLHKLITNDADMFNRALAETEKAHLAAENARVALMIHREEHGC